MPCDNSPQNLVNLTHGYHILAHYYLYKCANSVKFRYVFAQSIRMQLVAFKTKFKFSFMYDLEFENELKHLINELDEIYYDINKYKSISYKGRTGFNKDRIIINNDKNEKLVYPEELDSYLSNGWIKGRLEFSTDDRANKSKSQLGRIAVNNGDKTYRIHPEDLDKYLANGYVLGVSEKIAKIHRGRATTAGRKVVNDGKRNKFVKPEDLDKYLALGFTVGALSNNDAETRAVIGKKNKLANTGRVHVHNCNGEHYMVHKDELQSYLDAGFSLGTGITKQRDRRWVHKGYEQKNIHKSELEKYLNDGWSIGSRPKK